MCIRDRLVRALRIARIAHLRRLLTEYDYVVSMDADSLACQKPDFAAPGAWDVALRPVPVSVRKGPARDLPPKEVTDSPAAPRAGPRGRPGPRASGLYRGKIFPNPSPGEFLVKK